MGGQEKIVNLELSPITNATFSTTAEKRNQIQKLKADNPKMNIRELLFNEYYKNFR
jgi:hypothetical protein